MITSAAKIYHLLLLKELHELGDINDEEYTALIRTLFSMAKDSLMASNEYQKLQPSAPTAEQGCSGNID